MSNNFVIILYGIGETGLSKDAISSEKPQLT